MNPIMDKIEVMQKLIKYTLKEYHLYIFLMISIILINFFTYHRTTFVPDAYYYFTIANNFAKGNGITFDNHTVTTGFHPLWFLILSFLSKLFVNMSDFLKSVFIIQNILFFVYIMDILLFLMSN